MSDKYEDLMISPVEADQFLKRIGLDEDLLERYVKQFQEEPHSSVHKIIALILISRCAIDSQNLGDVYFAVRDLANRMEPVTTSSIGKSEWEIQRDVTVIKTGITEEEYEARHQRPY